MACSCKTTGGSCGDCSSGAGVCEPGPGNEPVSDSDYACGIGVQLQGVVDEARRLKHELGLRPYRVFLVWTKRNSRQRADELRRIELVPVRVTGWENLQWKLGQTGSHAEGTIRLTEVSPAQVDEDLLRGRLDGRAPADGIEFFYEVVRRPRCEDDKAKTAIGRYALATVPEYNPDRFWWELFLVDAEAPRAPEGTTPDRDQSMVPSIPRPPKGSTLRT